MAWIFRGAPVPTDTDCLILLPLSRAVRFHNRAFDQIQAVARLRGQRIKSPFPDAAAQPTIEAIVRRRVGAIATACRCAAQRIPLSGAFDSSAWARPALRHQRLEQKPLIVAEIKSHTSAHGEPCSFNLFNELSGYRPEKGFCSERLRLPKNMRALAAEASI